MAFEGFRVVGTRERPSLTSAGRPQVEVVIDIETDRGATGSLTLTKREYESMTDEELASRLIEKSDALDRAMRL